VDLEDLKKLKIEEAHEEGPTEGEVQAIVRVRESGYVPAGVTVRARIDDQLFTANVAAERLGALRGDAKVVSVEVSRALPKID